MGCCSVNTSIQSQVPGAYSPRALSGVAVGGRRDVLWSVDAGGQEAQHRISESDLVRFRYVSGARMRRAIFLFNFQHALPLRLLERLRSEMTFDLIEKCTPGWSMSSSGSHVVLEAGAIEERFKRRGFSKLIHNVGGAGVAKRIILTHLPADDLRVLAWGNQFDVAAVFPVSVSVKRLICAIHAVADGEYERAGLSAIEAFRQQGV